MRTHLQPPVFKEPVGLLKLPVKQFDLHTGEERARHQSHPVSCAHKRLGDSLKNGKNQEGQTVELRRLSSFILFVCLFVLVGTPERP